MNKLLAVEGVAETWAAQFGDKMLERIRAFSQRNGGLAMDVAATPTQPDGPKQVTIQVRNSVY